MRSILVITIIFLSLTLLINVPESSASGVFTITDIKVSGTGSNAHQAKDNAITEGEGVAFNMLLKRIANTSLDTDFPDIQKQEISDLVLGYDVQNEKITNKHYEATINISFNQVLVENLLKQTGIGYVSKRSDPVILLPVLTTANGEDLLWQNNNTWRQSWEQALQSSGFANFIIPKKSARTFSKANLDNILSGTYPLKTDIREQLNTVMQQYNSKKILLSHAKIIPSRSGNALEVSLTYINKRYPETTTRHFYGHEKESMQQIMQDATIKLVSSVERSWKAHQARSKNAESQINVIVPIKNLVTWNTLQKRLNSAPYIKSVKTKYLTVEYASIIISFQNGYNNLVNALAGERIYLERKEEGLFLTQLDEPPEWFLQNQELIEYDFEG